MWHAKTVSSKEEGDKSPDYEVYNLCNLLHLRKSAVQTSWARQVL